MKRPPISITGSDFSSQPVFFTISLQLRASTMAMSSSQPNGRNCAASTLNASLQTLNSAKDPCRIPPAQVTFDSATVFLTVIRVRSLLLYTITSSQDKCIQDTMANRHKYIYLGSTCASVFTTLERGLNWRGLDERGNSTAEYVS